VQQGRADHLLQPPYLLAERGLSDEHPLRRVRERACVSDCHQVPQMPELNTRMGRGSQAGQPLKSDVLRHFCHLLLAVLCAVARDNRRALRLGSNDAVFRAASNPVNS
jgi:hypothetical protein